MDNIASKIFNNECRQSKTISDIRRVVKEVHLVEKSHYYFLSTKFISSYETVNTQCDTNIQQGQSLETSKLALWKMYLKPS